MNILDRLPPFVFFTGKGGVGKTSVACATAIQLTESGKTVLLVSTDPASNVGQVFQQTIGHRITAIDAAPDLHALEIDPQAAAQQYRDRIVGPVRGVLPDAVVQGIAEQLSGACTTEIAAFDEFTALITDPAVRNAYDHVLFDTAPTGHTLRLLQLPGAWSSFIAENPAGASCLGPLAGLEKQRQTYAAAVATLADPQRTRMILVARPQTSSLAEAARTSAELSTIGFARPFLVINGLLPAEETLHDPLALALYRREQAALGAMPTTLRDLPRDQLALQAENLVGVAALRRFLADPSPSRAPDSPASQSVSSPALLTTDLPSLSTLIDELAEAGHGLIMMLGKGGVGKTTMAAAVAVALAERGYPVHLTTSDPAAHLAETLGGAGENLTVSRIDPRVETARYQQHVLATKGATLDAAGKALLEEDLRSPCTEEIAVFQAFSRAIRLAGTQFVVMDTAPTGHTLLLLDATGAYHREVTRHQTTPGRMTTPMMQLQNPAHTRVCIVTVAETTPVLEAVQLQEDLRRAGIEPWAWLINASLAAAAPTSSLLQQRAAHELVHITDVCIHHAQRVALVPMQVEEPVGIAALRHLVAASTPQEA